jgi:Fe-Mn family superoxide dismutase
MSTFELISLPFAPEALEPVISRETIALHHGKHLLTYVNNLNAALPGTAFEHLPLEEIVRKADGGIFNNAGQILNHNLYFEALRAPRSENRPEGKIAEAIAQQFGSFEAFQKEFVQKGATLFGSGWVWLSKDKDGKLVITQEPNAQNPVTKGLVPLLTFDVWEHAYYVDYQNRRADHLAALWQIVNWDVVEQRYCK